MDQDFPGRCLSVTIPQRPHSYPSTENAKIPAAGEWGSDEPLEAAARVEGYEHVIIAHDGGGGTVATGPGMFTSTGTAASTVSA